MTGWGSRNSANEKRCSTRPLRLRSALFVLPLCVPLLLAASQARSNEIRVVFRFDDPSARTDIGRELRVVEAFRRHGMNCTFAVIPYVAAGDLRDMAAQEYLPLPEEKAEALAAAAREGVLEIAQHGYSHQASALVNGEYSEFTNVDYDKQLRRIEEGKRSPGEPTRQ